MSHIAKIFRREQGLPVPSVLILSAIHLDHKKIFDRDTHILPAELKRNLKT